MLKASKNLFMGLGILIITEVVGGRKMVKEILELKKG